MGDFGIAIAALGNYLLRAGQWLYVTMISKVETLRFRYGLEWVLCESEKGKGGSACAVNHVSISSSLGDFPSFQRHVLDT